MSAGETPRTDGFEIVVSSESPILGNRYRAWADFARTLERELVIEHKLYTVSQLEREKLGDSNQRISVMLGGLQAALTTERATVARLREALEEADVALDDFACNSECKQTRQMARGASKKARAHLSGAGV